MKRIDLSMIKNPLGASKQSIKKIRQRLKQINLYTSEDKDLIQALAKNNKVKKNNILLTDGADGALTLIAQTCFKNKKVVIPMPSFSRYEFYTEIGNGKSIFIKPNKDMTFNEKNILETRGDILLFANPNNPTGFIVNEKLIQRSLNKFELVILDETLLLEENGYERLLKRYKNLVIVRSFSKLYGLAGLRIGYIISRKEVVDNIRRFSSPFKVNYLAQVAALEALKDKEFVKKVRRLVKEEKEFLFRELKEKSIDKSRSFSYIIKVDRKEIENLKDKIGLTESNGYKLLPENFLRVCIGRHSENKKLVKFLKGV